MIYFLAILGLFVSMASPSHADTSASTTTQPASILDTYHGGFKDDFPQELVRVRSYVLSVQSDIASQLGLQYGQGFLHPVTIRFDDGAPANGENPFFYVQSKGSGDGFSQDLVVNVEAYAKRHTEFAAQDNSLRAGFRYALTEVMLNDQIAGDPDKSLPLWVQEGVAVYGSGEGDNFVKDVAERVNKSRAAELSGELNSPEPNLTRKAWAQYYLAIKYIASKGALEAFLRNELAGKSAADSIQSSLGDEWPAFEDHVRSFSSDTFEALAHPEDDGTAKPNDPLR